MFVISNEQMNALNKEIRKIDKAQLEIELSEIYPALPKDELDGFIELGLEKTARYGINEDLAIEHFIRLMIDVARDFDEHPKAHEQLTRKDVNPNLTVELARELLTPDEWREAESFGPRASIADKKDYV